MKIYNPLDYPGIEDTSCHLGKWQLDNLDRDSVIRSIQGSEAVFIDHEPTPNSYSRSSREFIRDFRNETQSYIRAIKKIAPDAKIGLYGPGYPMPRICAINRYNAGAYSDDKASWWEDEARVESWYKDVRDWHTMLDTMSHMNVYNKVDMVCTPLYLLYKYPAEYWMEDVARDIKDFIGLPLVPYIWHRKVSFGDYYIMHDTELVDYTGQLGSNEYLDGVIMWQSSHDKKDSKNLGIPMESYGAGYAAGTTLMEMLR